MAWVSTLIAGLRSRPAARRIRERLREVSATLEALNHTTEKDFLVVGSRLMDLHSTSRELADLSQSIAGRISGSTGDRLLASLERLVAEVDSMETARGRGESLQQMVAACDQLRHALARMEQSVMTFQVLSMLTRVETARVAMGGDDWQSLAAEVKSMSGDIGQQVAHTDTAAESLAALLADGHRTVAQSEEREMRLMRAVAERLMREAEAFRARRRVAGECSSRVVASYREIARAIETLATGIQFHDITRQQIEHTVSTLREAGARPSSVPSVAGLEGAQLRATQASFLGSVESIRESLLRIGEQVRGISSETADLLKNARSQGESFFAAMETGGREALQAMAGCRAAESRIHEVTVSSRNTLEEAAGRVSNLESIGVAVERLALNAGIRATHLCGAGDPLSVLAAAVKALATETAAESSEMNRLIGEMQSVVGSFAAKVAARDTTPDVAEDLKRAIAEIHESVDVTSTQLDRIGDQAGRLSRELSEAGAAFSVDRRFREVVEAAIATLDELHGGAPIEDREVIDRAASRYTMHSERLVHGRFRVSGGVEPERVPAAANADSLGDNVELF